MFLPTGLQAALFPRSFHDDFPLGRGWIAATGGVYDEHLVRDVGALFLALSIVSVWAWWRGALCAPLAVAWLVSGPLHLVFHLRHLDHLDGLDRVAMVASLAVVPPLAVAALLAERATKRQVRR